MKRYFKWMKQSQLIVIFIGLFSQYGAAAAGHLLGPVTITAIGCHINKNICFVETAGAVVGISKCHHHNEVHWNNTYPSAHENFYILHEAFITGRKVDIQLLEEDCDQDYPMLDYVMPLPGYKDTSNQHS